MIHKMTKEENEKRLEYLKSIVRRLPDKPGSYQFYDEEKTIIFLYIDRLKTSQIALATGKSESAVRQIISRTKIKLRMLYEKEKDNDR